jgi:DNA-binding response OmpR family regulator
VHVLIADDEPVHLFLLEMYLRKWGFDVISSGSGSEAWQILQEKNSPRLAILDWQLSGMDGIKICAEVRRIGMQPYKYLFLLTGRALERDILKGKEAGADDYLTKPYQPEILRARLVAACKTLKSTARGPRDGSGPRS